MSTTGIDRKADPGHGGDPFLAAFEGGFRAALRWPEFDALWARLRADADGGWYAYAVGEAPPEEPLDGARLIALLDELEALLKREHDEDYCGIVYADDLQAPAFVKIYDPNNLGSVCGSSDIRTLPGWVLSRLRPAPLAVAAPAAGRRRWWRRLLGA